MTILFIFVASSKRQLGMFRSIRTRVSLLRNARRHFSGGSGNGGGSAGDGKPAAPAGGGGGLGPLPLLLGVSTVLLFGAYYSLNRQEKEIRDIVMTDKEAEAKAQVVQEDIAKLYRDEKELVDRVGVVMEERRAGKKGEEGIKGKKEVWGGEVL